LRVAKELAELTGLEQELRNGNLSFSAARELSRVMTRATETQWLARARGRNQRDIENLVAGHRKGNHPDDPRDPALMTKTVMLRLLARQQALLQQTRAMFEAERGEHLELEAVIEAACMRALEGEPPASANASPSAGTGGVPTTKAPRPAHQVIHRTCDTCGRAEQEARGTTVPVSADELARVACDAEVVREADIAAAQANGTRRPAPTLTIPQKVRDLVWARDGGRCRFPGCRAARNLALHHLEFQMHGGTHTESNLVLLCDGHHKLLHDGVISITGQAPDALVFMRDGGLVVDPRSAAALAVTSELLAASEHTSTHAPRSRSRFDDVVRLEHAKQALVQLGFKTRDARRALDAALTHVGRDADVAALVQAVLAMNREAAIDDDDASNASLAKRALVQSGYPSALAIKAVEAAQTHVGLNASLETLIMEAFRRCTSS
jgi:Holliday junction resolvasome RuvABC DNA-binding subunit